MSNQEQKPSPDTSVPSDETSDTSELLPATTAETQKKRVRKKHRILRIALLLTGFFVLLLIVIAGWFGFVPGLSDLLGARAPKDLGVRWTESDFISYRVKTASTFNDFKEAPANPLREGKKTVFADPKTVENLTITQEEITAAINSLDWAWLPAERVQVKLSDGGVIEVSGTIKMEHMNEFIHFIGGVGYDDADVSTVIDWGKRFVNGAPFYARGAASVQDNQLSLDLQSMQIGRFSAPLSVAKTVVITGGSNGISNSQHLTVRSAQVDNGVLTFTGTYPTTIYVKH